MADESLLFQVHWAGHVILMTFLSLAALEVVKMTTSNAASDKKNQQNVDISIFSVMMCGQAFSELILTI